jgi:predicted PurR-regulated permease PerM
VVPSRPPALDSRRSLVTRAVATLLLGALGLFVVVWLANRLRNLLVLLVVAFFFSFAMEPAVERLARRGWRRGSATGLVMGGLFVISLIVLFSVGRLLFDQAAQLTERAPQLIQSATDQINDIFGTDLDADRLSQTVDQRELPIRDIATNVAGGALTITGTVVGLIFNLFTVALFAFYLTADGPRVRRSICSFLSPSRQRIVLHVWEVAIEKTGGYLYSRFLLAVISALFGWAAFSLIGVPYAVALGLWLGLTSQFIPTIGTYLGGALPILIALIRSPTAALLVFGYIIVYQQLENYLLSPRITAHTMSLHPAIAFGSVIAGGSLAGGVGALLALPAAAIAQAIGTTYVRRHEVVDTDMVQQATSQRTTEDKPPQRKRPILDRFRRA